MSKLYWTIFETDFGWVALIGCGGKLVGLEFPKPTKEAVRAGIPEGYEESKDGFGRLPEQIKRYFAGERVLFDCDLDLSGFSEFEKQVLLETRQIPYGSVISYKALAALVGRPCAARAVGNAMRKNPVPLVIPCHRVLHSDGGLGGFGGGLDMKRRLLALEEVEI